LFAFVPLGRRVNKRRTGFHYFSLISIKSLVRSRIGDWKMDI